MADTFTLTAAFDKASYVAGDLMTLTVSGSVTSGSSTPVNATINITAADGSSTSLTASSSVDGTSPVTWLISSVTDAASRAWTISGDGHSATATA